MVDVAIDGSYGRNSGNSHSDVHFLVTVAEARDVERVRLAAPDVLRATCDPVLIRVLPFANVRDA